MDRTLPDARGDIRPIPDPTRLTTEQLDREIGSLRAVLDAGLASLRQIIEARLNGNDRAIQLLQSTADKFPQWVDEKIAAVRDVVTEKFNSIEKQFTERDVRTEQAAGAVKIAVDAALQAQKEAATETNKSGTAAITKSETATTKQIDQLGELIRTMTKGFDDKIGDVKDRLTRIEGKGEGVDHTQTTRQSSNSYVVALASLAVAIVLGSAGLILAVLHMKP